MSRYIDADAIKDKAWKAESEACFYELEDVVSVTDIDEAPSIDIEPKRGEWVDDDFVGQYRCSECDYYAIDEYDFCPNCGADMREREDE